MPAHSRRGFKRMNALLDEVRRISFFCHAQTIRIRSVGNSLGRLMEQGDFNLRNFVSSFPNTIGVSIGCTDVEEADTMRQLFDDWSALNEHISVSYAWDVQVVATYDGTEGERDSSISCASCIGPDGLRL